MGLERFNFWLIVLIGYEISFLLPDINEEDQQVRCRSIGHFWRFYEFFGLMGGNYPDHQFIFYG